MSETDMNQPQSALTCERTDLWRRALDLATNLTSYQYPAKMPLADGTITACGGIPWRPDPPPKPKTPEQREQERIQDIKDEIADIEAEIEETEQDLGDAKANVERLEKKLAELRKELLAKKGMLAGSVVVPEGAMEWLLHEVGHWVAATPEERALPNYGFGQEAKGVGKAREWQAWAFEEIVLGAFGHSRDFSAPSHRGGVAFAKNVPIPAEHLRHVERQIRVAGIDPAEWRTLYGEWVNYERQRHTPSWRRPN